MMLLIMRLLHVAKDTAFNFTERSDEDVQETTCLSRIDTANTTAHIIPFGYHGIENNSALVIGWSSEVTIVTNYVAEIEMNKRTKRKI